MQGFSEKYYPKAWIFFQKTRRVALQDNGDTELPLHNENKRGLFFHGKKTLYWKVQFEFLKMKNLQYFCKMKKVLFLILAITLIGCETDSDASKHPKRLIC